MPKFINHKNWTREDCDSGWKISWVMVCNNYIRKLPLHKRFQKTKIKTNAIIKKMVFDKESDRQKEIRNKPLPVYMGGSMPTFKPNELTNHEWHHRYNLEPQSNFHYE